MSLTRRTFLGLAGALAAAVSALTDHGPRWPADATDEPDPAPTEAARDAADYRAIVGVL